MHHLHPALPSLAVGYRPSLPDQIVPSLPPFGAGYKTVRRVLVCRIRKQNNEMKERVKAHGKSKDPKVVFSPFIAHLLHVCCFSLTFRDCFLLTFRDFFVKAIDEEFEKMRREAAQKRAEQKRIEKAIMNQGAFRIEVRLPLSIHQKSTPQIAALWLLETTLLPPSSLLLSSCHLPPAPRSLPTQLAAQD